MLVWLLISLTFASILAFSPYPFQRFGRFVLFSAHDGFKYSEAFIKSLSVNISLSDDTQSKLQQLRVAPKTLFGLSRIDLHEFNISTTDAANLVLWSKEEEQRIKVEEERRIKVEEERRIREEERRIREEERRIREEQRRIKEEERKASAKMVFIFNDVKKVFEREIFSDDAALRSYLESERIRSLALLGKDGSSTLENAREFEYLDNGSHYSMPDKSPEAVDVLRKELIRADKTKAEWSVNTFLSGYLKKNLKYIGSEIIMKGPSLGDKRGDVDTLYISEDGSLVVLLERKTMLSEVKESVLELIEQINKTTQNFSRQDTIFFCNSTAITMKRGLDYNSDATIVEALYCKAGPTSVFETLRKAQIHVIKDALEYFPPLVPVQTLTPIQSQTRSTQTPMDAQINTKTDKKRKKKRDTQTDTGTDRD